MLGPVLLLSTGTEGPYVHSTVMGIMRSHAPLPELSRCLRALWRVAVLVHDLLVEGLNSWLSASTLETFFEQIEQRCRAEIELPRGHGSPV
jgi:hypothetical protein